MSGLGPAAGAAAIALGLSVLLAYEVEAFQLEVMTENWHRRRSEAELARLNVELEHRVRARTAELEAVIENSRDAIWSVDRQGVGAGDERGAAAPSRTRVTASTTTPRIPRAPSRRVVRATVQSALRTRLRRRAPADRTDRRRARGSASSFSIAVHPIITNGVVTGATRSAKTSPSSSGSRSRPANGNRSSRTSCARDDGRDGGRAGARDQPAARRDRGLCAGLGPPAARRGDGRARRAPNLEEIAGEALRAGEIIRRVRDLCARKSPQQQAVESTRWCARRCG